MNDGIRAEIGVLGGMIKADERYGKLTAALDEYERCEELIALIEAYNGEQDAIIANVNDKEAVAASQVRIDGLYEKITTHPKYVAYISAKEEFERFTGEVFAELQYAITGQRPCTHDCSSCGGCG